MRFTIDTTPVLEEQFFRKFSKSLVSRFNLDSNHANEVAFEVLELMQLGDLNLEEVNTIYSS